MLPNPFELVLNQFGKSYRLKRDNQIIGVFKGVDNEYKGRKFIGFKIECDIQEGDYLINSLNEEFYVDEITYDYIGEQPSQKMAFYKTKKELKEAETSKESTFHIENAYGSVIGNQSDFTLNYTNNLDELRNAVQNSQSNEKEQLDKIVDLLEMIIRNQIPPSKGLFSKFSDVIQKNSWITSHIGSAIVTWLTAQM